MKVVSQLNDKQIEQLHRLYQNEWWCKGRTLEETKIGVANSQIIIGLIDEQSDLVGFARILTDTIFKALIFDVIIADTHRGKGLGKALVDAIKSHSALQNVKHFELYCKPDMIGFYEAYGFSCNVGDISLMRWENN